MDGWLHDLREIQHRRDRLLNAGHCLPARGSAVQEEREVRRELSRSQGPEGRAGKFIDEQAVLIGTGIVAEDEAPTRA